MLKNEVLLKRAITHFHLCHLCTRNALLKVLKVPKRQAELQHQHHSMYVDTPNNNYKDFVQIKTQTISDFHVNSLQANLLVVIELVFNLPEI